jgi:hypothetical protein
MFCSIYLLLSIENLNTNFHKTVCEVLKLDTLLSMFRIQFSIVGLIKK